MKEITLPQQPSSGSICGTNLNNIETRYGGTTTSRSTNLVMGVIPMVIPVCHWRKLESYFYFIY